MSIEQKRNHAFDMIQELIGMKSGHQHAAIQLSIKKSLNYWKQEFAKNV